MGGSIQGCPDPCKDLLAEILRFMANIQKRDLDLRENKGNLPETKPAQPDPHYGNRSLQGERQQYEDQQRGLRRRLQKYEDNNCGDPPPDAEDLATRPVPAADPKPGNEAVKRTAEVGAAIGAGYIAYRVIRMIPSLFPPLWWTIPENAVIP